MSDRPDDVAPQPPLEPPPSATAEPRRVDAARARAAELRRRAEELKGRAAQTVEHERQRRTSVAILVDTYERDRVSAGGLLAGGLAFRLFLWMLPFALVVVTILGFVADLGDRDPAQVAKGAGLSAAFAGTVANAVDDSGAARIWLLLLGLWLTYLAAGSVVKALVLISRLAWRIRERSKASGWRRSTVFSGLALALLAANVLVRPLYGGGPGTDLLASALVIGAFGAVAVLGGTLLPHAPGTSWWAFLPGAAIFALGIEALRLVSTVYLAPKLERVSELYGSLGMASVFLVWLYLIARLIVAASFTNATLWGRSHPSGEAPAETPQPDPPSRVEPDAQAVEGPQP